MNMKHVKCYKDEYPRPQFVRNNFTTLDGKWFFAFDDLKSRKHHQRTFPREHWQEMAEAIRKMRKAQD